MRNKTRFRFSSFEFRISIFAPRWQFRIRSPNVIGVEAAGRLRFSRSVLLQTEASHSLDQRSRHGLPLEWAFAKRQRCTIVLSENAGYPHPLRQAAAEERPSSAGLKIQP